ncbi:ferritin-like domain-containing protein [Niabella soli]|uniref:Tat (Twin-arginine translocation) pathway signal sequence containing protein n=1 Tax=Niabella soli DSM 19437 TaxID=929713 RepID=W0F0R9_9BACT|nr:ferritin-like domain-containing protein [Niabella soli]AHF14936.1 Tat (twin-arginine translocation) pathway signal sequence containing protein [Niabella soli DSM 19437]
MKKETTNTPEALLEPGLNTSPCSRSFFLSVLGLGAASAVGLAACSTDDYMMIPNMGGATLDFKDDTGVLNYAYALEQLEAAFYIKVAAAPPNAFTATQKNYFQDVQYHEIAHREFFKKALGSNAIPALEVDFSSINFTDAASVWAAAKAFEDLGVAAYNGAGVRIKTDAYLVVAGQIVSVEARHAAWVHDQISNGSFADLNDLVALDANNSGGLDGALTPDKVLPIAQKYIKTKINVINL